MASPYETLEIERSGRVATLWMNRPDVFNAFNEQLIAELARPAPSSTPTPACGWWCWRGGGSTSPPVPTSTG
jgi:methylglutaconyl-CoA hydratase